MARRYFVNLAIGTNKFTAKQCETIEIILFNSFGAEPQKGIPNQWIFEVVADSKSDVVIKINEAISAVAFNLDVPIIHYTHNISNMRTAICTMTNDKPFNPNLN